MTIKHWKVLETSYFRPRFRIDKCELANGNFLDFRNFLIALETIPSLELIEMIEVQSVEGSRNITVRFWLAQE